MYKLKLYTYLEGTWTRNTVTSKAIPRYVADDAQAAGRQDRAVLC